MTMSESDEIATSFIRITSYSMWDHRYISPWFLAETFRVLTSETDIHGLYNEYVQTISKCSDVYNI